MMLLKYCQSIANKLTDIIFPHRCFVCSELITSQHFCHGCWNAISFASDVCCDRCGQALEYDMVQHGNALLCPNCIAVPPLYRQARHLFAYNALGKKIIHNFKYYDDLIGIDALVKMLCNKYNSLISNCDFIVPVPLHNKRLLKRKFNQAAVIANVMVKLTDKKVCHDLLHRVRYCKPQVGLNNRQRKFNVKNCFAFNYKYANICCGAKVVIVDDVITSGSTINECVKLLLENNAASVDVITLAKTSLIVDTDVHLA